MNTKMFLSYWVLPVLLALPAGLRANENFEILKNARKIVFLGDSITYGGERTLAVRQQLAARIFADEQVDSESGVLFKSGREDGRGDRGDGASLYHED